MASRHSLRAFLFAVRVAFGLDTVMWRFASAAFAGALFGGGGPTGSGGGSNLLGFGGTGGLLGDGSSSTVTSSSSSSNSTSSNSGSLADADSAALGPAFIPTGAAATAGFVICAGSAATADFAVSTRFISSSPGNAGTGSAIYETSSFGFAGMAFDGTAIHCTALAGGALLFVLFGGGGGGGIIAVARVAPSDGSICCLGGGGNGGLLFFATGPLDSCTGAGLAGSQTSALALAFRRAPFLSLRAAILGRRILPSFLQFDSSLAHLQSWLFNDFWSIWWIVPASRWTSFPTASPLFGWWLFDLRLLSFFGVRFGFLSMRSSS